MSDVLEKKTYGIVKNQLNASLIAELESKNENLFIFPALKTEKRELNSNEIETIKKIVEFDWLILTDVFAADYFIEALSDLEIDLFVLDNLTICVFGEAVADRLRYVQIHSDVIPSRADDEFVLSSIMQFAGEDLTGSKILVANAESKGLDFVDALNKKNALVTNLSLYRAELDEEASKSKLITLLKGGAIDEFIFSSPEDLISLKQLAGEEFPSIFREIKLSSATEIAYQTIQENGFRPLYFHYQ